ncbi:MAG: hypothetical protein Q8K78_16665 [Planctomycetaceae bacterium]|nr:hypothetical protein [Planctomycetaceae bacterium]
MCRWWTAFLLGIVLVTGPRLVAAEDDPFAEEVPPVAVEPVPLVIPAPEPPEPETITVAPPPLDAPEPVQEPRLPQRSPPSTEPSLAQQRVHARAAQEARNRKTRIEQRRHGVVPGTSAFFPSSGPFVNPSLFYTDPGIRVAFRPITMSGLEPLPGVRPRSNVVPKKPLPRPMKSEDENRSRQEPAAEIAVPSEKP